MTRKTIEKAQICAITLQNAKQVNEYQWIGAGTDSLNFDREALDDKRICAWSKFNV